MTIQCRTSEETAKLGKRLGQVAAPGMVFAFRGGLGVGKTCFIQGLAEGLGITDTVNSPTYTIANEYEGRLKFFHIDAYRLNGAADFEMMDAAYFLDSGAVCAIEWSENINEALPANCSIITISILDDGSRQIQIAAGALESELS
ncbi:MAG: tRNA (adenosine(37)-N6)-threonylcarbamoyltransferase complex ATPase subunit type 1 TsaE [Spirochaetes bacterium GWD1_61_31]|nr:MAG: tRNA (adenosine(37)-N6)-threonylcarbamoyltransferase complex ATPase subunit type 1 TsaE [Spirochaetes bacterium GWB1_60_80]OHD30125.1 MAG: tRNA (adenosine(37)-N6)-threonylcarbamoyltransferase complex ATPase subunit type 1 TsaE [Spirochaetes bacterium GWC1_61_12]OHD34622.1 MAG: tRNA (adenosine(37)-N6)-threonylcarbamoyltransferase complex ATPase subunit type 1 TsaE [Spirochaetes bacterium GWD1_61_31]OHD46438.1 MAG: tRNA (adenosine(37)-N6)-threonylcarbamoyltransferase complex ATPase subunit